MRVLTSLLIVILFAMAAPQALRAADVDELLGTGEWLHGPPAPEEPPVPDEPLYAYA